MGRDIRAERIAKALSEQFAGSIWKITRARQWKVAALTAALDAAHRHGLPVGTPAAGIRQYFCPEEESR